MGTGIHVAKAAHVDLDDIVRVHAASFPGSALTRLGAGAVLRYYQWQFDGPHDVVALVGATDDRVEGFCVGGVFRGALSGFLRRNRVYLAARVLRQPWVVRDPMFRDPLRHGWRSLRRASAGAGTRATGPRTSPAGADASFGILSIAVSPSHQGTGLAQALLDGAEHEARALGYGRMHLTVEPHNRRAIAFYQRNGWEIVPAVGDWHGAMAKQLRRPTAD